MKETNPEDLVAYLDGELSDEEARALEERLHHDPRVRAEADGLRQAWEMLDFLPKPSPSPDFTNRTLERLAPVSAPTLSAPRPRRGWRALGWAAALALAATGGYLGYRGLAPTGPIEQDLVRDLRLIENKPLYDLVGDLEFLRSLDDPSLFGEENVGS